MDWIPIVSLIVSIITGPIVVAAVGAMHKNSTRDLIVESLKEHADKIEKDMLRERERNGEVYALKAEVAEMKGYVMQVVATLSRVETKLDKIDEAARGVRHGG